MDLQLETIRLSMDSGGSAVKKFAFGAAILGLTGVLSANLMALMIQKGALPSIALIPSEQSLKRQANNVYATEPSSRVKNEVHRIDLDRSPTAVIPTSASLPPCRDSRQIQLITHSVDGTRTVPIATSTAPCGDSAK
jgi:hypothetical protein